MSDSENTNLHTGEDGITRCYWGKVDLDYQQYHDEEWGRPTIDDFRLFEKICLEGFQSGLSWLTILRKRENFRKVFCDFDYNKIAKYNDNNVADLLQNSGIIRHRGKIEATINNANRAIEMVDEFGSLSAYIWQWEPKSKEPHIGKGEYNHVIPSITQTSQDLSKDLKKRGFKFVGSTICYAHMQACGMVNDHSMACYKRKQIIEKYQQS